MSSRVEKQRRALTSTERPRASAQIVVLRVVIVITAMLGINYIAWRWVFSLNWDAWWIAVPLIAAETYSLIDVLMFGMTVWRARQRPRPPVPAPTWTSMSSSRPTTRTSSWS